MFLGNIFWLVSAEFLKKVGGFDSLRGVPCFIPSTLHFLIDDFISNIMWTIVKLFKSSVIRQKCESENGCSKKRKHAKFSEKRTYLTS